MTPEKKELDPGFMSRWSNDESELITRIEDIELRHGFIPRDLADELSRVLTVKLERLKKIQGKVESTARKDAEKHVARWAGEEGNLIMILHAIQNEHGYVPREVAMELSRALGVKLARIYEVITFYHYFKLVPPGKHNVAVCMGTACYLKGAQQSLNEFQNQLKIQEGHTTQDRMFHLEVVRCIGCCGLAPAIVVDGITHPKVKSSDVSSIIANTRHKEDNQ